MPDIPAAEVEAFTRAWLNNFDCKGGDCDDSACPVCIAAGLAKVAELRDRRVAAQALRDVADDVVTNLEHGTFLVALRAELRRRADDLEAGRG